jgi:hypothetical protein
VEKQPIGHGPEGCDENGPAATLLVGHVSIQICSAPRALPRPILIATKAKLFMGQDTSLAYAKSSGESPYDRSVQTLQNSSSELTGSCEQSPPARCG